MGKLTEVVHVAPNLLPSAIFKSIWKTVSESVQIAAEL
jgi:hypothetical protein